MKKHTHTHTHTHTHPSTTLRGWSPSMLITQKKHKQLKTLPTPPTYITVGEQNS